MLLLAWYYTRWHYVTAIGDMAQVVRNIEWFLWEFFSISLLLRSFFVPFHRLEEHVAHSFDLSRWFEAITVNVLMRLVGMLSRLTLVVTGGVAMCGTACAAAVFLVIWLLAPLLMCLVVGAGVFMLVTG